MTSQTVSLVQLSPLKASFLSLIDIRTEDSSTPHKFKFKSEVTIIPPPRILLFLYIDHHLIVEAGNFRVFSLVCLFLHLIHMVMSDMFERGKESPCYQNIYSSVKLTGVRIKKA